MKPGYGRKLVATMALLAGLALSSNTWAAVIFYSTPFFVTDGVSGEVGTSFSGTLSGSQGLTLPRFDPTLGSLQAVEIQFQSSYDVFALAEASDDRSEFDLIPIINIIVNERNDAGIDALIQGSLRLQLTDPSSSFSLLNFPSLNAFCSDESMDAFGRTSCFSQQSSAASSYNGLLPLSSFSLAAFAGADPLNLFTSMTSSFSGNCDGGDIGDVCDFAARINWTGTVGVTYTYGTGGGDPVDVPEPRTIFLMTMGMALLFILRRRTIRAV